MMPLEHRHVTKCQGRGRPPQDARALTSPSAKHAIASARLAALLPRAQLTLCGGVLGPSAGA